MAIFDNEDVVVNVPSAKNDYLYLYTDGGFHHNNKTGASGVFGFSSLEEIKTSDGIIDIDSHLDIMKSDYFAYLASKSDMGSQYYEVLAFLMSLRLTYLLKPRKAVIVVDSDNVKSCFDTITKEGMVRRRWALADIWQEVSVILRHSFFKIEVISVKSHSNVPGKRVVDSLCSFAMDKLNKQNERAIEEDNRFGLKNQICDLYGSKLEGKEVKLKKKSEPPLWWLCSSIYLDTLSSIESPYVLGTHTGKKSSKKSKDKENAVKEPDLYLGKPNGGHIIAIVETKEVPPILEYLHDLYPSFVFLNNKLRSSDDGGSVLVFDLSAIRTRYKEYDTLGYINLRFENNRILDSKGHALVRRVVPIMRSKEIFDVAKSVYPSLVDSRVRVYEADITDILFLKEKNKTIIRYKESDFSVNYHFVLNGQRRKVKLKSGHNLPTRNLLAKFTQADVKVEFVVFKSSYDNQLTYGVVISNSDVTIIYSSFYWAKIY